jgi:hypothetical protein
VRDPLACSPVRVVVLPDLVVVVREHVVHAAGVDVERQAKQRL